MPAAQCAGARRHPCDPALGQGRTGADQRHAGVHGAGHRRAAGHRPAVRSGGDLGRAHAGRGTRQRRTVRSAHPCRARPAGTDRLRRGLSRAHGGQRDQGLAPEKRRSRAGPVQPALPAPGHGRVPGPDALCARRCWCAKPMRSPTIRWCSPTAEGEIVSGGNFHAEPVALAADAMAVAIAEIGAITERRIAMLVDTVVSRLPPFLTPEPGLNSGFMIVHVTAAALASENKSLAHPASVDSLPTSANQEDHVSMATFAARRLQPMLRNTAHIVAIELLAAAQGIEFLRPLQERAGTRRRAAPGAQRLARDDAGPQPGARHRGRAPPGGGWRDRSRRPRHHRGTEVAGPRVRTALQHRGGCGTAHPLQIRIWD